MEGNWFQQVKIIDPNSPFNQQVVSLYIDSTGTIREIVSGAVPDSGSLIHQWEEEVLVSPGWFDMQVHLSDPGYEYKESLQALNQAALLGGFTGILCYPNTQPAIDSSSVLRSITSQTHDLSVNFFFAGCLSEKNEGKELAELYDMHLAGARAFCDGTKPVTSEGLLSRSLRYLAGFDGILIHYPLSPSLAHGGQINEGKMSLQLGMPPIPEVAETANLLRDLEILKYEGGQMHIQPVSSPQVLALLSMRKQHQSGLSVGTPISYFSFSDEELIDFDSNLKVFPPLRNPEQIQALLHHLATGTIDVITTAHQAQGVEEKELEFSIAEPGMLGLQSFLHLAQQHLIAPNQLSWTQLIEKIAIAPRKLLKLEVPKVAIGERAELTFFAPGKEWVLSPSEIPSRAKNTPLLHQQLTGKCVGIYNRATWHSTN